MHFETSPRNVNSNCPACGQLPSGQILKQNHVIIYAIVNVDVHVSPKVATEKNFGKHNVISIGKHCDANLFCVIQ